MVGSAYNLRSTDSQIIRLLPRVADMRTLPMAAIRFLRLHHHRRSYANDLVSVLLWEVLLLFVFRPYLYSAMLRLHEL
jgi:hypothetical protein